MPKNLLNHLFIGGDFLKTKPYTYPKEVRLPGVLARNDINREQQGNFIKVRFEEAIDDFNKGRNESDFVYLVFKSAIDFRLDLDKFDDKGTFRIAFVKEIITFDESKNKLSYFESGIYLDKKGISDFLKKVDDYLTKFTPISIRTGKNIPRYNALVANIDDIRAATLKSFWQEPEIPFPDEDENVWWEIWLDKNSGSEYDELFNELRHAGIEISDQWIMFPEYRVGLIKGNAVTLSQTLLYSDKIAELRKPKELADLFTNFDRREQTDWINDLRERVENRSDESIVSVCLLDSGINHNNPLLADLVSERNLDSIIPDVGFSDTSKLLSGHGTPMAGLILYGDLTDVLSTNDPVHVFHHLESIKLIHEHHPHEPQNYGYVTLEALSKAEIMNPGHKRIVCLSITSNDLNHLGKPTVWSGAIDQFAFGSIEEPNETTLFLISAGNILEEERSLYPLSNDESTVNDPAQAFNAITVGAYTLKDSIDLIIHPASEILAKRGTLSPSSTTSLMWEKSWCRKPDIVMEGGNQALQRGDVITPDSLQLLSTSKGSTLKWLTTFGDTSGATALASRFAAQLHHHYPNLWPETIRALIIHSADWTPAMLGKNKSHIDQLGQTERKRLLETVGYGVPNLHRAMYSAHNSLSLISEASFSPLKRVASSIKSNEFHLYALPWPSDILSKLGEVSVKLTVTLSYFIEPNPGSKRYAEASSYASYGLRFKMIHPLDTPEDFAGRISKEMQDESFSKSSRPSNWLIGEDLRNKGSIHKDIWEGTAADLATRNSIAIYPTSGWWKNRKKLKRFDQEVRYSLVVTIDAPNVDIYNVVKNQIDVSVPVSIPI